MGSINRANGNQSLSEVHYSLAGLRAVVMGLGRFGGGVGAARWLVDQGAIVTVSDAADEQALCESVDALADLPITFHLGAHDIDDLETADLVVVNPAVRKDRSEFFQEVVRRGVPWTTELNLFCERCPAPVIGITGTYGKSTTAAMLAHVLSECHRGDASSEPRPDQTERGGRSRNRVPDSRVFLGGNIGRSLLADLGRIRATDLVVLEISSAQLEDVPRIPWRPDLAVITTLSPHHLDRYGSYENYLQTKLNILGAYANQKRQQAKSSGRDTGMHGDRSPALIVGRLDAEAEAALQLALASREGELDVMRVLTPGCPLALRVPGKHNQANAASVLAVCSHLQVPDDRARAALATFAGLPHRIEFVRNLVGVDYYNDSKSTSPATIETSLEAFDRPIVAIVGGQAVSVAEKKWRSCAQALSTKCRAVVCMGQTGSAIVRALQAERADRRGVCVEVAEDLPSAIVAARLRAQPGDAVLFSPGAPSFDVYANFVARGRNFMDLVSDLK